MAEFCKNGHERTESNTSYTKITGRNSMRRWCLDCRNDTPPLTDTRTVDERMEDIEDLVRFGATFEEIMSRGGFNTWNNLRNACNRKGKTELLDKLKKRKGLSNNRPLNSGSDVPGAGNSKGNGKRISLWA